MISSNRFSGDAATAARVTRRLVLAAISLACWTLAETTDSARAGDSGNPLHAGAAVRVVNPTRPAVTIGHRVMERFTNVYADLRVQAMVLQDHDRCGQVPGALLPRHAPLHRVCLPHKTMYVGWSYNFGKTWAGSTSKSNEGFELSAARDTKQ